MVARYEVTDAQGAWQVFTPGQPPRHFPTREAALSWIHQQGGGAHADGPATALDPDGGGGAPQAADAEPYLPPEQATLTDDPGTAAGDEFTSGMDPHPAPGGLKAEPEGGG
jgi:hypothetical protein